MQTNSIIEKDGKVVGKVYVYGSISTNTGEHIIVVKSLRTGKLQEFASVDELKARLEPMGCKLVISYGQLPELQKLSN